MGNIENNLREKIDRIIITHKKLKEDNENLSQEKSILEKALKENEEKIAVLTSKYNSLKIAQNLEVSEGDKDEALKKVNEIVREINKCIALLNT